VTSSGRRLLHDGGFSFGGAAIGAAAGLVLTAVVGRAVGTSGAGLFFQAVGVFTIAVHVGKLGADTGLIRFLSSQVALHRQADLGRTVVVALVPVCIVGVLGSAVLYRFAEAAVGFGAAPGTSVEAAAQLLRTVVPYIVIASVLAVLLGATRGLGGVLPFVAVTNLALPLGRVVLVLLAAAAGAGVSGVLELWAAPLPVLLVVAAVWSTRRLRRAREQVPDRGEPRETRRLAREFWGYSSARGAAAALEIVLEWADVLILAALRSPAEAGIYAVASRSMRAGQIAEQAVRVALSPRISALLAVGDTAGASSLFLVVTRAIVLLAWPFYLLLIIYGEVVLDVFGPGFRAGGNVLAILSVTMMVVLAAGTVQTILLMGGRSSYQMGNKVVAVVLGVSGSLALVPQLGMTGAALAWSVAVLVDAGLASWQVRTRLAVHYDVRALGLAAAIPILTFGVGGAVIALAGGRTVVTLMVSLALCGTAHLAVCWRLRRRLGLLSVLPESAGELADR
jgi:O-antigen/teichoic acid export membrane protein